MKSRSAFTLIELLVVIAIIAILAVVVVLVLNPAQLLAQSRDANRVSDMATLSSAVSLYTTDQAGAASFSLGTTTNTYVSIPDPNSSSTCGSLAMMSLGSSSWACSTPSAYRTIASSGWLPINFKAMSAGSPIGSLPVDPVNASSSGLFYAYNTNGTQFEITADLESSKYKGTYGNNPVISLFPEVLSEGTPGLSALYDPQGLLGYWPLNEGTGTVALDKSGSGNNGTWSGTPIGTNGSYYGAGLHQNSAGEFDGSTDYITPPLATNIFANAAPFTVTGWMNQAALKYDNGIFGVCTASVADECLHLAIRSGNLYMGFYSDDLLGGTTVPGTWYYLAFVYAGGGNGMRYVYLNGALVASGASSASGLQVTATTTPEIGEDQFGVTNGTIQGVRLYNRALSPGEIQALYNAER